MLCSTGADKYVVFGGDTESGCEETGYYAEG